MRDIAIRMRADELIPACGRQATHRADQDRAAADAVPGNPPWR
jgi:hypothetical protein